MSETTLQFAICVISEEDSDLDAWKVYQIIPDSKADRVGCWRVIDESGED